MLILVLGCLMKTTVLPPPLIDIQSYRAQIDWDRASAESVDILSRYIQVDTTNPPGNEQRGAQFLSDILNEAGIPNEIHLSSEGRGNLIARLKGSGEEKPLCLLSHIDVVTYEEENWTHHPLSGKVVDGYVWGRGALDMKSTGVIELMSMLLIKRHNIPLKRDIVLLAVSDEEVNGEGMKYLVDEHWESIGCSHLLNEGGMGLRDVIFDGQTIYPVSVAEKGPLWFKMYANGPAGHGSTPRSGEAIDKLLAAIRALENRRVISRINPALSEILSNAGAQKGGLLNLVMRNAFLRDLLVKPRLKKNPLTAAVMTNTVHLTGLGGANEPNVVPSEVFAQFDCRLLPGTEPEEFLAELKEIAGPDVRFEVLHSSPATKSDWDDPLYYALVRYALEGEEDAVAGPFTMIASTDSGYARAKGTTAYGFMPFELSEEDMYGFHGANERISIDNLNRALKKIFSAVVEVTAKPL